LSAKIADPRVCASLPAKHTINRQPACWQLFCGVGSFKRVATVSAFLTVGFSLATISTVHGWKSTNCGYHYYSPQNCRTAPIQAHPGIVPI
jgi:hypothetical protein